MIKAIKEKTLLPVRLDDPRVFGNNLAKLEEVLSERIKKNPITLNIILMDVFRQVEEHNKPAVEDYKKFSIVKDISR